MKSFFVVFLLYILTTTNSFSGLFANSVNHPEIFYTLTDSNEITQASDTIAHPRHKKLKAALLALTLGHFGAHRIYLSTNPRIPAAYTLTLGGGLGILPLVDFFNILFTKDISRFQNSSRFFMWQDEPVKSVTQP